MRKFLTKALSLICALALLMAIAPSALAYTEETVINWADKTVYTNVTGSCSYDKINTKTTMNSLFGGEKSSHVSSGFNVKLDAPVSNDSGVLLSKFTVDLGAEREIDYIELYQNYNRIKHIDVYAIPSQSDYNTVSNTLVTVGQSFLNKCTFLGDATFNGHGEDAATVINKLDNISVADKITFDTKKTARFLLFTVTENYEKTGYKAILLQKLTINKKGNIGVNAAKNWADKTIYSGVNGKNPKTSATALIDTLFGVGTTSYDYNVQLEKLSSHTNVTTPRSWFAIDLGATRRVDYVELYQYKDRMKDAQLYALTQAGWNSAQSNGNHLSDEFIANTSYVEKKLCEETFIHTNTTSTELNKLDECNTPDTFYLDEPYEARYLLLTFTSAVDSTAAFLLQKVAVNCIDNSWANAFEYDIKLFHNSGKSRKIGVFAAQKNGGMMIDCDLISKDVADLTQVNLYGQKLSIDADATSIDFIILDMNTLEPLMKMPYVIEKTN